VIGLSQPHKLPPRPWATDAEPAGLVAPGVHLTPEVIDSSSVSVRGVGRNIELVWKDLAHDVHEVCDLPVLRQLNTAQTQELFSTVRDVAKGVGLAASGVSLAAGVYKLVHPGDLEQKLDGCLDLAVSGAVATTLLNCSLAPLVLAPIAATLGIMRAVASAMPGHKGGADHVARGVLAGTRAVAISCAREGEATSVLSTVGAVVGNAASAVQMVWGGMQVVHGAKTHNLNTEVAGFCDLGLSVGTMLAATGVGTIPGLALVAVSGAASAVYAVSKGFHAWTDRHLEGQQEHLQSIIASGENLLHQL
jgi:hypothetical protein